jgi:hypothetical protein
MKTLTELVKEKAALVIAGYPTQGVSLDDLVSITIELCEDFERHPTPRFTKSTIKRAGFNKWGGKYRASAKPQVQKDAQKRSNSGATGKHG